MFSDSEVANFEKELDQISKTVAKLSLQLNQDRFPRSVHTVIMTGQWVHISSLDRILFVPDESAIEVVGKLGCILFTPADKA